jgi:hypothetical protein
MDVRESDKIDEKQLATWIKQFKLIESGLVVQVPQIDVSFSAGVEKLRRLKSRLKAFWKSLEVLGGEHEKVGFDRGPVGI